MEQTLTIDGRKFHGVTQELSAAQDDYLIGHLRLAGALDALIDSKPQAPLTGDLRAPSPEAQAERLLTQIMVSGRGAWVLAGCLTEVGSSWSFEEAERNAARFAAVTDADDKAAMREAIVDFVAGFFLYVIRSARTSRKSSSPN